MDHGESKSDAAIFSRVRIGKLSERLRRPLDQRRTHPQTRVHDFNLKPAVGRGANPQRHAATLGEFDGIQHQIGED
jgi:hypothetical protein